jgi:hypothetical protein
MKKKKHQLENYKKRIRKEINDNENVCWTFYVQIYSKHVVQ